MPRAETISPNAKENVVHDLVNVYDWVMLPSSVGEKFFRNGTVSNAQDCATVLPRMLRRECRLRRSCLGCEAKKQE